METFMIVLLLSIASASNAEFIERSNEQLAQGYKWTYVVVFASMFYAVKSIVTPKLAEIIKLKTS